jgi:hypothetical protein
MQFSIEPAASISDLEDLAHIHHAVFVEELGLPTAGLILGSHERSLHILARDPETSEGAGTLTVVETTGESELAAKFGLTLRSGASSARLARLAVLPKYRGSNVPLQMILRAGELFLRPRDIAYSWLLFDPSRAARSKLCRLMRFAVSSQVIGTEYGPQLVMFRDELASASERANHKTRHYISWCEQQENGGKRTAPGGTGRLSPSRNSPAAEVALCTG